jgi:ATP-dependent Lon protease
MAIGGLKEKTMAALRQGIHTVIIPHDNLRDLEEIDQTVRKSLNFIAAKHVDTVLESALVRLPQVDTAVLSDIPKDVQSRGKKPTIRQ